MWHYENTISIVLILDNFQLKYTQVLWWFLSTQQIIFTHSFGEYNKFRLKVYPQLLIFNFSLYLFSWNKMLCTCPKYLPILVARLWYLRAILPLKKHIPSLITLKARETGFWFRCVFSKCEALWFRPAPLSNPGSSYAIVGTAVSFIIPATAFRVLLSMFLLLLTDT